MIFRAASNDKSFYKWKKNHNINPGKYGVNGALPSTFDTIHQIDLIVGTYKELSLYFQLIGTTWCLIGFHSNYNHINDVTSARHLGFSNFQIFLYSNWTLKMVKKQHFAIGLYKIVRSIVKLSIFRRK